DEHGGSPHCIETMEVDWSLFDVCCERYEVLVDERSEFVVVVRLGFQPSACASGGRSAEVDHQRLLSFLGLCECLIGILQPIHFHDLSSVVHKLHKFVQRGTTCPLERRPISRAGNVP